MIDTSVITSVVERESVAMDLFLVEVKVSAGNDIEVIVDSDTKVQIDQCMALSRAIEAALDRDTEDFQLTVASAGIGQPLKLLRQYEKLVGSDVDVVLKEGTKLVAKLTAVDEQAITVEYEEKVVVEGKKRKVVVTKNEVIPFSEIKSTVEHLSFK